MRIQVSKNTTPADNLGGEKKSWRRETKKGNTKYLGEGKTSRQKQQKQSAEEAWKAEGGRHHAPVSVLSWVTPLCGLRQQQAALDTQAPISIHASPETEGGVGGIKSEATCTGRSKQSSKPGR